MDIAYSPVFVFFSQVTMKALWKIKLGKDFLSTPSIQSCTPWNFLIIEGKLSKAWVALELIRLIAVLQIYNWKWENMEIDVNFTNNW